MGQGMYYIRQNLWYIYTTMYSVNGKMHNYRVIGKPTLLQQNGQWSVCRPCVTKNQRDIELYI